jgi:PAS domain S-box-containing protein
MPDRIVVSSADFVRNIGLWQEKALHGPIAISYHGRERLILLAAERYVSAHTEISAPSEALDQLSAVLDNMVEGYVAISEEMVVTAANHVAESYFGRSRRSMEGTPLTTVFPSLRGSLLLEQVRRVLRTREAVTFETESIVFPGRRLECRVFPLGSGVGILFSNVTEREALRAALVEAEALHASVAEHPEIAVAACDVRGRLVSADARFCASVGFEPDAILNCRFIDIVAPSSRREVNEALEHANEQTIAVSAKLLAKDLTERVLTLSLSPISTGSAPRGVCILATTSASTASTARVA